MRWWPGIALIVLMFAWTAAPADAGQYTVWSCRGPEGVPISTVAWQTRAVAAATGEMTIADDCASGGSLRIEATPEGPLFDHEPLAEAVFEPPAGTDIPEFRVWRYVAAHDGPRQFEHPGEDDYAASFREWVPGYDFSSDCAASRGEPDCAVGSPDVPLDESNLLAMRPTQPLEPAFEKLGFWVGCVRIGCEPSTVSPPAVFKLFRSAVTVEDDHAPTVGSLSGNLAEPAAVSGTGHLFVGADDVGGGVEAFEFSVDGAAPQRVPVGGAECGEPFFEPQPCPRSATRGISVDTAALGPGAHVVSGSVIDAAGNATPFGPVPFTVAEVATPPADTPPSQRGVAAVTGAGKEPNNGTPAVEAPRLRLRPAVHLRGSGASARLSGTLTTPTGVPIAGAQLRVEVTELGKKRGGRPLTVRTGADGSFAIKVGDEGAHTVVVSYSPTIGGPATRSVDAVVKTPLSLRLETRPGRVRNGQAVRFHGALQGAGGAAAGATVEIQAIADGHWTTIETVTTAPGGGFDWTHRFRYVERNALFSFRAVVAHTPGWPWPTVKSPRIKLAIDGAPR